MNTYEKQLIVDPTKQENGEHPKHIMDAIEKLNLPHPEYEG